MKRLKPIILVMAIAMMASACSDKTVETTTATTKEETTVASEEIKEIAKKIYNDGSYDYFDCVAYLYRGLLAHKLVDGTEYSYEYFIVPEDILTDTLGFTMVSEDGDKVTYNPPDTGETLIYFMDSYVYYRSLGMITAQREFYVGNAVG